MIKKVIVVAIFSLLLAPAFAVNPTVTVTRHARTTDLVIYKATWSTTLGTLDTAIVWRDVTNTKPWYVGYMGSDGNPDSTISYVMTTDEATAESLAVVTLLQVSYVNRPSANSVHDDWATVVTNGDSDAVAFTKNFNPLRTLQPVNVRILVADTESTADATQNMTMYIAFPRPKQSLRSTPIP